MLNGHMRLFINRTIVNSVSSKKFCHYFFSVLEKMFRVILNKSRNIKRLLLSFTSFFTDFTLKNQLFFT